MNDFLQRLKQRKLVQWAVAYVAAAFALLQGIDIVAQQFGWPDGLRRGITLALVIGFFVMLVLAWYHGERGAQRVSGTEILILALLLALGGGFLWRFAGAAREPVVRPATVVPAAKAAIPEKSIAVLPFDNLSRDPENAYFAEGVQDEILTRLAKVADLKVISRTSTQRFKSSPDNLPQIAKQLGVMHILEGSVQKANDQVRVNVQLIHAATDAHLWADTFDRKLTDIFAVESEIAQTIAESCRRSSQARKKSCSQRSLRRIRKPTSFTSRAAFSGTNARRPICGNRSTTSTPRSPKTPTTRSPMRRWPRPGFCCRPTMRPRRKIALRQPRLRSGKRSAWTRLHPTPMPLSARSGPASNSTSPARPPNSSGQFN